MYFVSFATVNWMDVFVREEYFNVVVERLNYCRANLGTELFCWCIMPSHVHLIFRAKNNNPSQVLGRFKEYTSKSLRKLIAESVIESRREWLLWMAAGFVTMPGHWKYSSASTYCGLGGVLEINLLW